MTIVAKTILTYQSESDLNLAREFTQWREFISAKEYDVEDQTVLDGLVVTRFWIDKAHAQDYVDHITQKLGLVEITPASFVLEDYTEPV